MSKEEPLHIIKIAKRCPVNWDEMGDGDVVRTCRSRGALMLNEERRDTVSFQEALKRFKGKFVYRRTDGKPMLRECGLALRWPSLLHRIGLTGAASLFFVLLPNVLEWP